MNKRYTVTAWLQDHRCNDNCRIETYNTNSMDDAEHWTWGLKRVYGDSVMVADHQTCTIGYIGLRKDQMVEGK